MICILGPTASGKTGVAIELALRLDGEIVSADSRQVYRRMDIGTSKPTPDQLRQVPHHLIDVADPFDDYSVVRYKQAALLALTNIERRGRLPLVVGGTGQYVEAVTKGFEPAPAPPDPALRRELQESLERRGLDELVRRLKSLDPLGAETIDLRNPRRVMRALEVRIATGRSIRELEGAGGGGRPSLLIGLDVPRAELRQRIRFRTAEMFRRGFVDEVRALWSIGYASGSAASKSIGYAQVFSYLAGRCTLAEAQEMTAKATGQYARRQMTWFRNRLSVEWHGPGPRMLPDIEGRIRRSLDG